MAADVRVVRRCLEAVSVGFCIGVRPQKLREDPGEGFCLLIHEEGQLIAYSS